MTALATLFSDSFLTRHFPLIAIVLCALLYGLTLSNYPLPSCDESTYGGAGYSLLQGGQVALPSMGIGEPNGRDTNALVFGRTYAGGLALTFSVLGRTLAAGRLFSLMGWGAAVGCLLWLARHYFRESSAAILGTLLFAVSTKALYVSHFVRPEAWLAAGILAVVAGLLAVRDQSAWVLAGGFSAAWLADIHPLGLVFGAAIGLVFCIVWLIEKRWWNPVIFSVGAGLAFSLLIIIRAYPDGITRLQMTQIPYVSRILNEPTNDLEDQDRDGRDRRRVTLIERYDDEVMDMVSFLRSIFWELGGPLSLIEAVLAVIGGYYAVVSRDRSARIIATIYFLALLLFGLTSPTFWVQYGALWSPAFYLLGAVGVLYFLKRWQLWVNAAFVGLIALNLAADGWLLLRNSPDLYPRMAAQVKTHLTPGARVLGDTVWWWALEDQVELITDQHLDYARRRQTAALRDFYDLESDSSDAAVAQQVVAMINPDYVLIDAAISCTSASSDVHKAFRLYIQQICTPIASVNSLNPSWSFSPLGQTTHIYACP